MICMFVGKGEGMANRVDALCACCNKGSESISDDDADTLKCSMQLELTWDGKMYVGVCEDCFKTMSAYERAMLHMQIESYNRMIERSEDH